MSLNHLFFVNSCLVKRQCGKLNHYSMLDLLAEASPQVLLCATYQALSVARLD